VITSRKGFADQQTMMREIAAAASATSKRIESDPIAPESVAGPIYALEPTERGDRFAVAPLAILRIS